ncbi:MAG TPA: transketolase C-terminal domain-containing protein [Plantibacter sp.]|uniref:alpha-ketoacid dehydrogenase subunit beta n=1 Tax=Plantibacter sp. TaxID=1871045 RepID=UPI002B95AFAE|nr:transketolase C-terminal domain-containing protein [Plantibacter sp.]
MSRTISYAEAVREATDQCLEADPRVLVMGLGVPDPKGVFGTTSGLAERHGDERVSDLPTSENGMTGVALGCAIAGMRPIMTHIRTEFAMLAIDQIVNQAAKWRYMFGGRMSAPLVIRLLVGRGWGQGPQHSQSLQAWFAHIPGLKVVMPVTPRDAKGLLIASVEDDDPVIFIEHRWLHGVTGDVAEEMYSTAIGEARTAHDGDDVTIAATSYMVLEAIRAAETLESVGVGAHVLDLRSVRPWDRRAVLESAARTGRLIVADTGWATAGFAAEVVAHVAEEGVRLTAPPRRIALPDVPTPTSPALAADFYPRAREIVAAAAAQLGIEAPALPESDLPLDVPDPVYAGPF